MGRSDLKAHNRKCSIHIMVISCVPGKSHEEQTMWRPRLDLLKRMAVQGLTKKIQCSLTEEWFLFIVVSFHNFISWTVEFICVFQTLSDGCRSRGTPSRDWRGIARNGSLSNRHKIAATSVKREGSVREVVHKVAGVWVLWYENEPVHCCRVERRLGLL